jgi:signal transduction histidine kinase
MSPLNGHLDFSMILASSVHDMKNSLAMLLGSISDISSQCDPNICPMHETLHLVQHEAQRVNRDLILLLTLYKMGQGKYFFNIEEINVHEYLEEIIFEYTKLLNHHGININLKCDPELTGYFDRSLIASIINTIISNAYKYTRDSISVTADIIDDYTRISVIDNGEGYPDKMLYNELPTTSEVDFGTGSTGLGLHFASQVAKSHKNKDQVGYIKISNKQPVGGCFSIYLP